MKSKEQIFKIPLKETEDKVVFEVVIDKNLYKNALERKGPIDILITIKTTSNDLEFDIKKSEKVEKQRESL
jgi:hypothetical protein